MNEPRPLFTILFLLFVLNLIPRAASRKMIEAYEESHLCLLSKA